jgi:Putative neutral zinc metallopeptidase
VAAVHFLIIRLAGKPVRAKIYPEGTETEKYRFGDEPIIYKSGNADFDFALAQTLAKITEKFGVLPGFAYYDDSGGQNAYATPRVRLKSTDGTVLMGINLFRRVMKSIEVPEVAIAGVCAHEYGHIVQFRFGLIEKVNAGQSTVKRSELQADYFSGFFAGLRKRERPSYPAAVVALTQHDFGDTMFGDKGHHGTPDERGRAVVRGFEASFRDNKSLNDAIQESTLYVLSV